MKSGLFFWALVLAACGSGEQVATLTHDLEECREDVEKLEERIEEAEESSGSRSGSSRDRSSSRSSSREELERMRALGYGEGRVGQRSGGAFGLPFGASRLREMRSECAANVMAIKTTEMAYDAEYNTFLTVSPHPRGLPGREPRPWGNGNTDFQKLGWHPDGSVRGTYSVATTVASSTVAGGDFTVKGRCDVDGDGVFAVYTATKSINTVFLNNNDTY